MYLYRISFFFFVLKGYFLLFVVKNSVLCGFGIVLNSFLYKVVVFFIEDGRNVYSDL